MKRFILILFLFYSLTLSAQEVLMGLSSVERPKPSAKGTEAIVLQLPFFDDFSNYEGYPDPNRWQSTQAFVGKTFAREAPTVGMVTLDALDEHGDLYPQASTNLFSADTLTSQLIRLDSLTGTIRRPLHAGDSIILSFFYLPGGWYGDPLNRVGSAPSPQDSLFLDFYDAEDSSWHVVWATAGRNADTVGIHSRWPWKFASVKIDNERYLTSCFQFRFRNYASLDDNPKSGIAGNCDQWNIDYVYLNYGRTSGDSISRDVAFVDAAPSMLKQYYAMPARQFTATDMASSLDILLVNRYNQTLASNYSYRVFDDNWSVVKNYDGGLENIPAFFPNGSYQTHAVHSNPPVNFSFPVNGQPISFEVLHLFHEGVGGDSHPENDTIRFHQVFDNYYAYDDGTPENGYGVTKSGPNVSKMYIACRYQLNVEDTLTAVDLFFNRTRGAENEDVPFVLCVWSCQNGIPGELLYRDDTRYTPYFDGLNRYHRYKLGNHIVVSDTIFVGFEQQTTDFINLGFDRNTDSRRQTFYRVSNEWMQSIWTGSIMMRPCFGQSALVGIDDSHPLIHKADLNLFPNPASDVLHIESNVFNPESSQISILDLYGRIVKELPFATTINIVDLYSGVYFLRAVDKQNNHVVIRKFIVR
ncbi:MAG: T9SS type A sorting domain-containing protein [Bacteroidales bacterium]|nr:T9SS type A sorting domain-containing protein [Bacteroidales bacterium]